MVSVKEFLQILPIVTQLPEQNVWLAYDQEADVLYINFKKPSYADDSELTDDDVIIRYEGDNIIGYTVLHATQRRLNGTSAH